MPLSKIYERYLADGWALLLKMFVLGPHLPDLPVTDFVGSL